MALMLPIPSRDAVEMFPLLRCMRSSRVNSWNKLLRVVAIRCRFVRKHLMGRPVQYNFTTPVDIRKAENYIFASIQAEVYEEDYLQLKTSGQVDKSSQLWSLSPIMDGDGVIRLQSRLQNAPLSYAARNPAILPNKHPLVHLLIQHFHELHWHVGEEQIIAALRTRAWIVGVRSAVRRVARQCNECIIRRAQVKVPRMGNLPECRVTPSEYPFEHVGVDVFGPVELAGKVKRWVLIFVCMMTRGIHMEVLYNLTADEVLQALDAFQSQRGRPRHVYSDMGTNFRGAENIYHRDLIKLHHEIGPEAATRYEILWHFNPSHTPHFGGAWERLIKSAKTCLTMARVLKHHPSERVFYRAVKAVEGRLNARPLTHTPVNPDDLEPLTPNHFLLGHANNIGSVYNASGRDQLSTYGYRRVQHLAGLMYQRWLREYLPVLTKRCKWFAEEPPIQVGDLVLVIDGANSREGWRRARVETTFPGKDGRVRVLRVKMADGKSRRVSVANVARLEIRSLPPPAPATGGEAVTEP